VQLKYAVFKSMNLIDCYRGNLSHDAFLKHARSSEETLRKEAIERTDLSHLDGTSMLSPVDTSPGSMYQVESTGAVVSLNSAVGLIHFYCSQLPSDRYRLLLICLVYLLNCSFKLQAHP